MSVGKSNLQSLSVLSAVEIIEPVCVCRYFSHSAQLSISSWTTDDASALDHCGHCDNCTRSPDSIERKDVTFPTWQILKIVDAVRKSGGKLTLVMLASLARGLQGGWYEVSQGGRNEIKKKVKLDLETVAGGPVDMNRTVGFLIPDYNPLVEINRSLANRTSDYPSPDT